MLLLKVITLTILSYPSILCIEVMKAVSCSFCNRFYNRSMNKSQEEKLAMKLSAKFLEYQTQEVTSLQSQPKTNRHLQNTLNNLWQSVVRFLRVSPEPQVWTTQVEKYQTQWNVLDPVTGQSAQFSSEEDVRVWLEDRYNQHSFNLSQNNLLISAMR